MAEPIKKETANLKKLVLVILGIIILGLFTLRSLKALNDEGDEFVTFTYEEIQMIERFQEQLANEIGPKAEVTVYKTKDGKLMLGWE